MRSALDGRTVAGGLAIPSSSGEPLGGGVRSEMESAFGSDFGSVRVHRSADAGRAAATVNAKAFTVGQNIYFGAGRYAPQSSDGRRLIAHELTHTLQQQSSNSSVMPNALAVSQPGDPCEREADAVAEHVVSGTVTSASSITAPAGLCIQRQEPQAPLSEPTLTGMDANPPTSNVQTASAPSGGTGATYEPGEREASLASPGLIESTPTGYTLYAYGVDQKFIKPEHQEFLRNLIAQLRLDDPGSEQQISVIAGYTDSVDSEVKNEPLRHNRAEAVQTYLLGRGAVEESVGVVAPTPAQTFLADNSTREGRARNRAVTIGLVTAKTEVIPSPTSTKSSKWALQPNAAVMAGSVAAVGTFNFILHDLEHDKKYVLQFGGFGGAIGASEKFSFPVAVAVPDETPFETTTGPVDIAAFNGGGEIHQAEIGIGFIGYSFGAATLHPDTKPQQIKISGLQFSFGADASMIGGWWKVLQ